MNLLFTLYGRKQPSSNAAVETITRVVLAGVFATVGSIPAQAATLQVCKAGCPFATVQSAVNAAVTGDQIFIARGVYTENVTISGKSLVLDGSGLDLTVIDGDAAGPVFTLGSNTGPLSHEITLKNLTITHGQGIAGGIYVRSGAALNLVSCDVVKNVSVRSGGGIEVDTPNGKQTTIINSTIQLNSSTGPGVGYASTGGGIDVSPDSSVVITGSMIASNTVAGYGAGLYGQGAHLKITNSVFSANAATPEITPHGVQPGESVGGAIDAGPDISITDSGIFGNTANDGGGIAVHLHTGQVTPSIVRTVITHNGYAAMGDDGHDGGAVGVDVINVDPGTSADARLVLDHDYIGQNPIGLESNVSPGTEAAIEFTDTTIGDAVNSGCIGLGCSK